MFLRNCWYVAAMGGELDDGPLARTILGEDLVLFRTADGSPAALEDRCCHRHAPLHKGRVVEGNLRCGYHGLLFDRTGQCIDIPAQTKIPEGACVKAYTIVARHGWSWIWMGDPALADESLIPDFHWVSDPGWAGAGERMQLNADYRLLVDNLLDLSHLTFLHETTIGAAAVADTPAKVSRNGDLVNMTRWMLDTPPPPTFQKTAGFTENIDRWQIIDWVPPSFVRLDLGGAPAGSCADKGDRSQAIERWNLNAITPETETTAHYFWWECRNFQIDDDALTQLFFDQVHEAFSEDLDMIHAQARNMARHPLSPNIDINADNAGLQARIILDRLIEQEQDGNAVAIAAYG